MMRSLWLPVVAGLMLLFAAYHMLTWQKPVEQAAPPSTPAMTRYARCVAASGLVEPQNESISIGSHLPGVVLANADDCLQALAAHHCWHTKRRTLPPRPARPASAQHP